MTEFNTLSERYDIKTFYTRGDVTNQESLETAFAACIRVMGQPHGGLTAAGIVIDAPFLEAEWEITQRTINVNIMGTFWAIKLLAQHLVDTKTPGSIVAISSINGQGLYVPVQPKSAYNASGSAINGLMGPLDWRARTLWYQSQLHLTQ